MPDVFQWWSQIIIPSIAVLASTAVATAALVASRRATLLARESEKRRIEADQRARDAALQERIRLDAREEAKLLSKWAHIAFKPKRWSLPLSQNGRVLPAEEDPFIAWNDARAALEQSFVPGAGALLVLTKLDVDEIFTRLPGGEGSEGEIDLASRELIVHLRKQRCFERIRRWGIDPGSQADAVEKELRLAQSDLQSYLETLS